MTGPGSQERPSAQDAADFSALCRRLRRASAWGEAGRGGPLNNITQAQVLAAASEVRLGRTATLAAPIESGVTLDNPEPAVCQMTSPAGPVGHPHPEKGMPRARPAAMVDE